MLKMTIKELTNKKWVTYPDPMRTTERVTLAKTFIGKPAIIELATDKCRKFFCGTEDMMKLMQKSFPDSLVMPIEDVTNLYENIPEHFYVALQEFWSPKAADTFDPPRFGQPGPDRSKG